MADNININGIQIPQLPIEDSPVGFEAIGYKSGRTSKVPLDTLATKVELQNTVVGTNLLGSKANIATIKSEVTTPSKGDTYKATDTGNYWKYNDVISETNPYDPNKWVDIGIIIPSDAMRTGGTTKTGQQLENNNVNSAHNVIGDFLDLSGVSFTANKELNISGALIDANNYSVSNPIPVSEMEYLTLYIGGGYSGSRNQYPIHGYVNESDSDSIWNPTFTNLKSNIKFFGQIPTEVKYVRLVIHSKWIGVASVALAKKNVTSQSVLDHISGRFYLDFNLFTIDKSLNFSGAVTFRSGYSTLGFKNVKGKNRIIIKGDYVVSSTNASRILHGYISNTDTVSIFQSDIIYAGGKMDLDVIIPSQVQYIRFYIPTDKLRDTYVAITSEIPQSADKAVQFSSRSQPKEVIDWSGNFTRNVLTPTDKDRSFPGIVARGNQVMLTYMNRADHMVNDWIGKRSIKFSTNGGVTFGEEYTLPTGISIGGAYRYTKGDNQNKITAFEGFLDRSGASGYYERSRPVVGTFDDVFNSNGQSGMSQSDYISIPSRQYPSQPIMSSKVIEHNGVLYACGYDNQQFFSPNNSRSFLLKSSDNGINWELVSMIPVDGTGECTIAFKGEQLIMVSRIRFGYDLTTENNKLSYSNDYGLTWITQEMTGYNVHNPQLFVFADTVFLMGRLILPDKHCLAILTLDDFLNVKDLYSLDNSSKVPSFYPDFMFTSDYMRIFTHKYIDETQTKSYVYTIDLPLSSLLFMSGKSISPISLKHIPMSQSDFTSLAVKDSNTIYYVY